MVILDYSEADSGFWASTPQGLVEAIKFQNHFYAIRRLYKRTQDAVSACRADVESGFRSIVVEFNDHAEVWAQLLTTVPVQPKGQTQVAIPATDPAKPVLTYRGQPLSRPSGNAAPVQKPLTYRGQKIAEPSADPAPLVLPDSLYFRGVKMG
ncbi:hypothetical protein L1047_00955 [Synechococcus sp. Nb3U1]|uniref:hypothetical protein n=1 Tax=Synechococcus sp. Nb3U1 TaxID=1914529 RepID=UPI001F2EBF4D|nr:hypothetical protein [Synechococcus sp. Nb3U1]MCF2969765.1 hypothetical protein [Synechococcus sp. Nb3U1]